MKRANQDLQTDQSDLKTAYGKNALATQVGKIRIVHLDNPSKETIQKRVDEVIAEEISGEAFEADCPLCQQIKDEPYDVVYSGNCY